MHVAGWIGMSQLPVSPRAVSEARVAEKCKEARNVARFRYSDMKEAARDCGGRGLMQIQWWEGRGFEVCPGCAVGQGTRESVGKGVGRKRPCCRDRNGRRRKRRFVRSKTGRCRAGPSARRIRVCESRFMRPAAENEVEFQKPRAFRRWPSERHIEDSAKCC